MFWVIKSLVQTYGLFYPTPFLLNYKNTRITTLDKPVLPMTLLLFTQLTFSR